MLIFICFKPPKVLKWFLIDLSILILKFFGVFLKIKVLIKATKGGQRNKGKGLKEEKGRRRKKVKGQSGLSDWE